MFLIQIFTGFEDNSSFVDPTTDLLLLTCGFEQRSNKIPVVREASLLLICYAPPFFSQIVLFH